MKSKPFQQLTPELRAQVLHALFPAEIPGFLNDLQGQAMRIIGDQALQYRAWTGPYAAFFLWVYVVRGVYDNVRDHHVQICRNRRAFARLLFKDENLYFSQHALMHYIAHRATNSRFKMAATLLFA